MATENVVTLCITWIGFTWVGVCLLIGASYVQINRINVIQKKIDAISTQLEIPTKYSAKDIQRLKELCK
jgi:hypothetical protein